MAITPNSRILKTITGKNKARKITGIPKFQAPPLLAISQMKEESSGQSILEEFKTFC
jgi:hypothetical protein